MGKSALTTVIAMLALAVGIQRVSAAQEQPRAHPEPAHPAATRPSSGHAAAPAAHQPPPAGRSAPPPRAVVVDGRGQVMDGRYNHGRSYAPVGTVARTLPPDYRPYYHHGSPYYVSGGVWYTPRAGGFVVIAPPAGLVIAALPAYYSTVWIGGVPYYYADNVYYAAQSDQSGYAVVPAPDGAPEAQAYGGDAGQAPDAPQPSTTEGDLIIYPKNGQSKDQQAADQYECHNWAKGQTGFDPTQPDGGVSPADADRSHANYDRARAACLSGRDYQVN
jgi:hypothetical protein